MRLSALVSGRTRLPVCFAGACVGRRRSALESARVNSIGTFTIALAILLQTSLPVLGSRQHAPQTALADGSALDPTPIAPPPVRQAAGGAVNTNLAFSQLLPETEAGSILQAWLNANPQLLNLSATPALRLDYLRTVPGVEGLRDRVYVHFVQTVQGIDVADDRCFIFLRSIGEPAPDRFTAIQSLPRNRDH